MTANKKEKKLKKFKNKNIIYVIESFILTAAAVFLSVISGILVANLTGVLCIIAASAFIACVLFLTNPSVIIISGVASFAITFTLNGSIISALASLPYVIIGAFIYFGIKSKNKKSRTQITVRIATVLAVFYFLLLALSFMLETGTFYSGMIAMASRIDKTLSEGVETVVRQYISISMLPAQSSSISAAEEAAQQAYLIESYVKELVMNFKAIIPAGFVLYNLLIAYLSTSLFKSAYNIFIPMANPDRKKIKNKYWRINISVASAIIMTVILFFSVVLSKSENIIWPIMLTNMTYILAPGFCLMGVYLAYDKIFMGKSVIFPAILAAGVIMLAFVFSAAVFVLYSAAAVLMAVGIYAALIEDIKKLFEKAKKALFGDGNDDDDDDDYID